MLFSLKAFLQMNDLFTYLLFFKIRHRNYSYSCSSLYGLRKAWFSWSSN